MAAWRRTRPRRAELADSEKLLECEMTADERGAHLDATRDMPSIKTLEQFDWSTYPVLQGQVL